MPSGAKKRKAAKKKKVHNSSTTNSNSHQGENEGGELSSPASQDNQNAQDPSVEVEIKGDENKSTEANGEEIETGEKTKSSNGSSSNSSDSSDVESIEKKEVILEPAPIESLPEVPELEVPIVDSVDETKSEETKEFAPPAVSLPETIPDTVVEPEVSPIVEPAEPVDSSLEEVVKVYDETKDEERKELLVTETPEVVEEQIVTTEVALKDDLPTSSVAESVSKDYAGETDTVEHSDRQAVVESPPVEERKMASWKNCCGIFELFSGSGR